MKDVVKPEPKKPILLNEIALIWIAYVEEYCNQNNIIPEDLIAFHREHSKSKIKAKKVPQNEKSDTSTESKHLNWRENLTKRKTGQP